MPPSRALDTLTPAKVPAQSLGTRSHGSLQSPVLREDTPAAAPDQGQPAPVARRRYRLKRRPEERVQLLSGTMDLVRPEEVFHFVEGRLKAGQRTVVANHNLHSLYLTQQDQELVAFFEAADLIQVDSVPLIFWAQIVGRPGRRFHRNTYLDWRDDFWRLALTKGWKVFFLGGKPGMALNAKATIERDWPGAKLGVHHGYFDQRSGSAENEAVLKAINDFVPDILFVGLGMPLQERWIHQNLSRLPACAAFPVGGAFDYEADVQSAAPRWIGQIGMEWMYRLMHDPQRLFFRYCIEPWRLMPLALKDLSAAIKTRYRALSVPRQPHQDDVFAKVRTQLPPVAAQALAAKAARRATDLEDTSWPARIGSLIGLGALVLMWTACLLPCAIWLMAHLALRKTTTSIEPSEGQSASAQG